LEKIKDTDQMRQTRDTL